MSKKLPIAAALLAIMLFLPVGGTPEAGAHPWGFHRDAAYFHGISPAISTAT